MSDFLGRIAARHAENAASPIVPRAASRFETMAAPVPDVVDREVSTPIARSDTAPATTTRIEARPSREIVERFTSVPLGRESRLDSKPESIEPVASTAMRVEQILKHVETIVNASPPVGEPSREPAPEPGIVATPVVPRIERTAQSRDPGPGRADRRRVSAEESEPTVIRVHIGRIDVRAAAPTPERQRSRSKAADAAKPMSLDRYLSGKDRA